MESIKKCLMCGHEVQEGNKNGCPACGWGKPITEVPEIFEIVETEREETEMENIKKQIPWERLCELTTKLMDKLLEMDMEEAFEFFEEELELESHERDFFEVNVKEVDITETETRCTCCPYHWQEEWEDFPCCHFDETHHPTPAPCEYECVYEELEEAEEFDWEEF